MEFIDYKSASELLGVPIGTLYSWVSKKQVPHHRFGPRLVRFNIQEIREWIEKHRIDLSICTGVDSGTSHE